MAMSNLERVRKWRAKGQNKKRESEQAAERYRQKLLKARRFVQTLLPL